MPCPHFIIKNHFRPILSKKILPQNWQNVAKRFKKWAKIFCSKWAKIYFLLSNVVMGNKLYEMKFFDLCSKKLELMKQIHLFKKGFVIFLQGATFSDFIETRLSNYRPLAIRICFPLFWRI